ncbi:MULTISPECIES: biopolymer transporter ExbD [unclassified Undibacterium]|uniref:ExbD/TolR family protein n=1 Tax=unclassified Undibacterium TaxID=2630295 RepID=UPI002AC91F0B|nr:MULTISPECIES: biopolymer transporter ExbD [unclassified Undibacterium]MEB0139769.1 biopolymer transporter ExbD [Undibacterium sp. CCC2.1]MEB0170523.1 biopolymer transporter ExbD [Undibacterium sp. CCC1.1]MEB0174464.1 biopolymer transporter ExbD [Undibacterium sp. CCC3.4]MEB0213739.1 biopolymer transporter ExbD [Undibacterium sp. 5I2]WPX43903.1 biopolymer transporter ExbD [Undibacterium sp. CCC3.4]
MNFRKGKAREEPEINLIPFIDVLLVILIFLMVTTTYSRFTELQITLPTADADKAQEAKPNQIEIGIDAQGRYKINQQAVSFLDTATLADDLKHAAAALEGGAAEPVIIINADRAATHQSVVDVLEAARIAGLAKVTFAAQASNKTK